MKLRSVLFAALGVGFLLSASAPAALAQHWHGGGPGWHGGWHGHSGWWGGRWWGPRPYWYGPGAYYAPPPYPYPYYYPYGGPVVTFGVR